MPCLHFFFEGVCGCVRQGVSDSTFVPATFVHRAQNARGTNANPGGRCLHAIAKSSRAGVVPSRSELDELGAATCIGTWLGHGLEKTELSSIKVVFVFELRPNETSLYEYSSSTRRQNVPVHSIIRPVS